MVSCLGCTDSRSSSALYPWIPVFDLLSLVCANKVGKTRRSAASELDLICLKYKYSFHKKLGLRLATNYS